MTGATWRLLGRHGYVAGASISESYQPNNDGARSYTATIRGFGNWRIWRGQYERGVIAFVISRVMEIRDRIDVGDETVFSEPNEFTRSLTIGGGGAA